MPIVHVGDVPFQFVILQCAACGAGQSVPLAQLVLGSPADPNMIHLPKCVCGAQETLARTFDVAPEILADHRKKVNAVAVVLKAAGQVHPNWAAHIKEEKIAPKQVGDLVGPVEPEHGLPELVLPEGLKLPC